MVLTNNKIFKQLFRFGIVGLAATAVHFTMVVSLVEIYLLRPLLANVFAFFVAFHVSYFGNRHWTFQGTTTKHQVAIPKLLLTSSVIFAANEGLFYFFLHVTRLSYPVALFLVLAILPLATFTINKLWVFRH